ncbi:LppX_LprAFG lipoprotein [Kribbella sp. NBC_01245]|uniref:LppX_LprAFG lipoprotein n=1 Tax=Kribbella sp. NBC_01245 TaxID=2903578 RepID=UPI002E2AF601|nr:LppX_LprAFG lipoprotein [Kribbella sp. NBC_01245]
MKKILALAAVAMLALTGCTDDKGDGGNGGSKEDAAALLADAKKTIDDAASVHFVITGRDLPESAQALTKGDGVATHAPAFKGKLTVRTAGSTIDAEVVSVGGKTYVKPSFSPKFLPFTPEQLSGLGAPDPAILLNPEQGLTSALATVKDPVVKGEVRDGSKVLTEVTGSIQGKSLAGIFPGAAEDKDFPSTFTIDKSSKQLVKATITGPFYGEATSAYDVTLDKYGEQVEIVKP